MAMALQDKPVDGVCSRRANTPCALNMSESDGVVPDHSLDRRLEHRGPERWCPKRLSMCRPNVLALQWDR